MEDSTLSFCEATVFLKHLVHGMIPQNFLCTFSDVTGHKSRFNEAEEKLFKAQKRLSPRRKQRSVQWYEHQEEFQVLHGPLLSKGDLYAI